MNFRFGAFLTGLSLLVAIAGCSAGGSALQPSSKASLQTSASAPPAPGPAIPISIVIKVPGTGSGFRARYISAATRSASLAINGGPPVTANLDLTLDTISITAQSPPGSNSFLVNLYDAPDGKGNMLSTAVMQADIQRDKSNLIPLVTQGVPASVQLSLDNPSPLAGVATTLKLNVSAKDAAGYTIVGGYAQALTISSSDATGAVTLLSKQVTGPAQIPVTYNGADLGSVTFGASSVGVADAQVKPVVFTPNRDCQDDLQVPADGVTLNPSGVAPLAAVATAATAVVGQIKLTVRGKHGSASDVVHAFPHGGGKKDIQILGLYGDYANTVDIAAVNRQGITCATRSLQLKTAPLPSGMPTAIQVDVRQDGKLEPGWLLVSYLGKMSPNIPLIIDNYGDIRWLLDYSGDIALKTLAFQMGIARLSDGNLYFGDQSANNSIYEVDMLGGIIHKLSLPAGYTFHHNVQEKPNGNLLMTVNKTTSQHLNGKPTIEDYVIEIDRQSGALIREWDLKQSLDENRTTLDNQLANSPIDWFHGNAVIYDPSDDTIIVSGRVQGVVKLTNDNKVKWILSNHKGWNSNRRGEDLNTLLLAPLDAGGNRITDPAVLNGDTNHPDFEWNWYQHAPKIMPNGDLILFDNGTTRNYNANAAKYSRDVEYRIDPQNMTVQQIWNYGKERGLETFSSIISDVDYLPATNHMLFMPGIRVVNQNGKGGKLVEVDYATKEVIFQMSISTASGAGFARADRVSLYP